MIHTTTNIDPALYEELFIKVMNKLKLTESELVAVVLKLVGKEMPNRERPKGAVKYQKGNEEKKWKIVHLYLTPEEYDHFVDMRTFFKMSVAHMISYGLKDRKSVV